MKKLLYTVLAICAAGLLICASAAKYNKTEILRNLNLFNSVVKELHSGYVDTLDSEELIEFAIDAMLSRVDPYTEYYPANNREALTSISTGQYGGIGAVIQQRREGGAIIYQPVFGEPAWQSGLRHGDIILKIDGKDVSSMKGTDEVSRNLRGTPGTTVHVEIRRPFDPDSIKHIDVVRRTIHQNPLPYYGVDSTGMGYICLKTFNENSANLVRDAVLDMMKNPDLRGLVLDLRNNGGGVIDGAVDIAGLFVPKGTEVVRTRGTDGRVLKVYRTAAKPIAPDLPLVILTNRNTASASEIVAGSLQDLDRAVIVGERSFGKGLVQTSRQLPDGALLKLTMARYYIPSGRLIQALDYSHRDADGRPTRTPDSLTNVFATSKGREVRDGGGITPDVTVSDTTFSMLEYALEEQNVVYDYANRFRQTNPSIADADAWEVTDSVFNDFKTFVKPKNLIYDKMTERGIKYLREASRAEGMESDSVTALLDRLGELLQHNIDNDLEFNRTDILRLLDAEISQRYYPEADLIRRSLRYDADVDSARAVLLTPGRVEGILNSSKK
ncbi:MAG: S41 family peptidase [Muribaculaceae bacterium]|nr:S41 family peptidase [Muribaculaceae bacterium]